MPDPEIRKYQKTMWVLFKTDDPKPPNAHPEFAFSLLYLHTVLSTPISELLKKKQWILKHIYLTVLQQSCLKITKQQRGLRSIKAIKNHPK